jgi:hypothetical protein
MMLTLLSGRYKGIRVAEMLRFKDIQVEKLND